MTVGHMDISQHMCWSKRKASQDACPRESILSLLVGCKVALL